MVQAPGDARSEVSDADTVCDSVDSQRILTTWEETNTLVYRSTAQRPMVNLAGSTLNCLLPGSKPHLCTEDLGVLPRWLSHPSQRQDVRGTYVQEEGITCFLLLPCMRHLAPPIPLSHLSPSRGGSTLDGSCSRKLVLPSLSSVLRADGKVLLGALYSKVKFLHPSPRPAPANSPRL